MFDVATTACRSSFFFRQLVCATGERWMTASEKKGLMNLLGFARLALPCCFFCSSQLAVIGPNKHR
jgi:hypothetical protein